MKAIVKGIDTNSHISFDAYCPEDVECFGLWITVMVGPDSEDGGHLYQVLVCTPDWIKQECLRVGAMWGRHMLIISSYDKNQIRNEIERYVQGCTGKDFWDIAQKVARIGAWEFEDYQG